MVLPLGISGHVLSPYRTNMRRDWIQGDLELQKPNSLDPLKKLLKYANLLRYLNKYETHGV